MPKLSAEKFSFADPCTRGDLFWSSNFCMDLLRKNFMDTLRGCYHPPCECALDVMVISSEQ
jgi:hypothetical protein